MSVQHPVRILKEQMHSGRKRFIALSFIFFGVVITSFMLIIFIWPGILAFLFFPDLVWANGEGVVDFFLNILFGVIYLVLMISLLLFIGIAPLIALPIALIIGIPSILGGIGLLRNKKWGLYLLRFESLFYLFIFPLGTVLAILTLRMNSREKRINSLD